MFVHLPETTAALFQELGSVQDIALSRLSVPHFGAMAQIKGLRRLEIDGLDAPGSEIIQALANLDTRYLASLQAKDLGVPCQENSDNIKG